MDTVSFAALTRRAAPGACGVAGFLASVLPITAGFRGYLNSAASAGKRLALALAIALAAMLMVAPTGFAPGASTLAKGKTRTVTRTFANGATVDIPATDNSAKANPYPLAIAVSGFKKGKITDIELTLRDFSHQIPGDVDMLLVAPNGKNAILFSDAGDGSSVEHLTITLDDEATDPLAGDGLTSGSFQPTDFAPADTFPDAPAPSGDVALATFAGGNPNGQWQLFVVDDEPAASTGTLGNGYQLTITAQVKAKKHRK